MIAITRDVSPAIANAELTHLQRVPIDYARAHAQHEQYRQLLAALGCDVISIPGDPAFPDCVFVEDTAIVLGDLAVITRPGAESRRGETKAIAEALEPHRRLVYMEAPATLDGGDVLMLDDVLYAGLSARSNESGIDQLRRLTGREVIAVTVHGALHLKTAITRVSTTSLLVNREWIDVRPFEQWELIDVHPSEPFAANALLLEGRLVYPRAFHLTRARLAGLDLHLVDADELAKAEGGVTCCALLVQ